MNISKEIQDFLIDKTKTSIMYDYEKYRDPKVAKVYKEETSNPDVCFLYCCDEDDTLNDKVIRFVAAFNPNNGKVLHMSKDKYEINHIIDCEWNEINDLNVNDNIKKYVTNYIQKYFKDNKEELIKGKDYTKYNYWAKEKIISNTSEPMPDIEYNTTLTKNMIVDFYTDLDTLIKNLSLPYIEKYKTEFTKYFLKEKALDEYRNLNEEKDIVKVKQKLNEIFNNDKYKTLKIEIELPNRKNETHEYKKDPWKMRDFKSNLLQDKIEIETHYGTYNFPITAIKSINWSRSLLYNRNDYINVTNDDIINDLIKIKTYDFLPDSFFNDKKFMKKIVNESYYNLTYMSKKLKEDTDFLIKLFESYIKNNKNSEDTYIRSNILTYFPEDIFSDLDTCIKFLDIMIKYDVDFLELDNIYKKVDISKLTDYNEIEKFIKTDKKQCYIYKLFEKLDPKILNSNEFLELAKKYELKFKYHFENSLTNITNFDLLKTFLDEYKFKEYYEYLNRIFKCDINFVTKILKDLENEKIFNLNEIDFIGQMFKEDKTNYFIDEKDMNFKNLVTKFISANDIDSYFEKYNIDHNDNEEILNLTSYNINFVYALDESNRYAYFKDECCGYLEEEFIDDKILKLKTAYGRLECQNNWKKKYIFYDDESHEVNLFRVLHSHNYRDFENELINEIIERHPEFTGIKTIDDVIQCFRDKNIEREEEER